MYMVAYYLEKLPSAAHIYNLGALQGRLGKIDGNSWQVKSLGRQQVDSFGRFWLLLGKVAGERFN
jgi:hypothetical protein